MKTLKCHYNVKTKKKENVETEINIFIKCHTAYSIFYCVLCELMKEKSRSLRELFMDENIVFGKLVDE